MPRIRILLGRGNLFPRSLSQLRVHKDLAIRVARRDDRPVLAAYRAPNHVRRARRLRPVARFERHPRRGAELLRVGHDLEVHRELVVGEARAAAVLVRHDEVAVGQLRDGRHTGAIGIRRIHHIVDDRPPCLEIRGGLVDHLLAVGGVGALVRVVADEGVLVLHEEGLPDGGFTVVGDRDAAGCDVGDEFPRLAAVGGGVEFDLRLGEVGGDRGARYEDSSCWVAGEGLGKHVDEGLVAEAPAWWDVSYFCLVLQWHCHAFMTICENVPFCVSWTRESSFQVYP